MVSMGIRFDFRNPAFAGTTMAERYGAALEMCEWAEGHGFNSITLSEHHGCEDGYLPSIFALAAAVAARTKSARIRLAAVVAPLHDPIRLAEDAAVVDHLSNGRLDIVLVNGYVPSEFEAFGKAMADRVKLTTEAVATLRQAWTGEPFDYRGRTVRVTPRPFQQPGPPIWLGGSSDGAARRAARIADAFLPSMPQYWDTYRDAMRELGKPDPGPLMPGSAAYVHVTDDPDTTWSQVARHAAHEMNAYGEWAAESGADTGYQPIADPDVLRGIGMYLVVTPQQCVDMITAAGEHATFMLHPLMGGVPPTLAWENLRAFEAKVLPFIPPA
jgi:alkanesulfonate monooxygenase SsuD/methylene tetrahydromethanopterin reductase-like flavin-dependent oxidoreductase (luciferase family)